MGATRQQVISQYGQPKSQITAGNREFLYFARERVVLRDGVVIEVELLPMENLAKAEPAAPAPGEAPATSTTAPASTNTPATETPADSAAKAATAEPDFSIKGVRPAGTPAQPAQARKTTAPATTTNPAPPKQPTVAAPPPPTPTVVAPKTETAPAPTAPPPVTTRSTRNRKVASNEVPVTVSPDQAKAEVEAKSDATAKKQPEKKEAPAPRPEESDTNPIESVFTPRGLLIAFAIAGAGVAYLLWHRRQRQLELAATSVTRAPFSAPAATVSGVIFDADTLSKLEWKRFEELVAAYYSKTGVVATRTGAHPDSPVNIRISWKGEARPFACVKCIAHPVGLIEVKPVQDLVTALTAEDIRRGYVVTTGKFSVGARDFAEEKGLTLLTGDIFLEKLNALPDAARTELMQAATAGDSTTPSCPKCDAKMMRAPEDPAIWRCQVHFDQQIEMRK